MFDLERIKGAGLEEAFRQMPAGAVIAEAPSGKLILINERARWILERNMGFSGVPDPEEIADFGDLSMFHPDGRPVEMEEWPLVRSITFGEEVRDEEHSYLLADGGHLTIRSDSSPIRDDEGHIVAGVLIVRDITERKRAEEQIAYHAHLLENVHDAVIATDERFLVTAWNEAAEVMYGWSADEVMGRRVQEVVPSEPSDEQWAEVQRELDETGRFRTEWVTRHRDGSPVHVEVTAVALRNDRGEVTGYLSIDRDISDRKRREEERASHAAVLEATNDFVGTTDLDERVLSVNPAGRRMLGIGEDEDVTNATIADYHPEWAYEILSEEGRPAALRDGSWSGEVVFLRRDGREVPTFQSIVSHKGADGEEEYFTTVARDITEGKRFELEQRRLADIVQSSSDFIGIADLEWRATFVNEAGQRMVGHTGMEEVRRTRVLNYIMPEDREFVRDEIMPTVMERGNWTGEFRLRHLQTGEPIPVLWDIIRIDDPRTGEPINIATVTRDITERKRAEEELRESEERLRFALESGKLGSWNLDFDTYDFGVSSTCKANFGLPPDAEFTYETLFSMIHPDDRERVRGLIEKSVSTGEDYEADYRVVTPAGETRWVAARGRVLYDGGAPSSMVGTTLDITRRKMDEEEIKTHARQQAAVAELGLRALSGHGLQTLMDEAVECVARTLGVEFCKIVELLPAGEAGGEELLMRSGIGWKEGTVGNSGRLDPQASFTLASEEPVIIENLRSETRFRPAPLLEEHGVVSGMLVAIPGRRDGPFGAMGAHTKSRRSFSGDDANFLQAVANVLAAAVEREAAGERLREVREAERSRIARDLHDEAIRDLTYALAEAQHVQSISNDPQPIRGLGRLVAALKRAGRQLRAAIYDLRLGGDEDRPFPELLEDLVELHRAMAPEDCDIRLELGDGVLSGPLGETGTELLRIVGEALTNARRHSDARNVRVAVGTSERKPWAEVSDDGRGFDPSREASAAGGGTGIKGMRERARALGGNLEIRSEPGRGSKVRFEMLPKKDLGSPEEEVRVLLVEDHASVRESIASTFEREAGFDVVGQAGSLAEARRLIEERPTDVAVVDLGLPDGYGGNLITALREANPEAQALVLSATLDRAETARAVECGAAGVLNKTAHLDEVVQSVRKLRAGETLIPMEEVVELLRFAGSRREREYEARRKVESLTPREKEVLRALAEGLDSKEVAERLHISLRTERNHVSSILAKLGVHSQLQALVFALRHGVAEIP